MIIYLKSRKVNQPKHTSHMLSCYVWLHLIRAFLYDSRLRRKCQRVECTVMTLQVHCKKLSVITYKSENSNIRRKIKGRHQPPLTFIAQLSASAASCVSLNTSAGVLTLSGTVTKSGREDAGYFTLTTKRFHCYRMGRTITKMNIKII